MNLKLSDRQIVEVCCSVTGEDVEIVSKLIELGDEHAVKTLNAVKAAISLEISLREGVKNEEVTTPG